MRALLAGKRMSLKVKMVKLFFFFYLFCVVAG